MVVNTKTARTFFLVFLALVTTGEPNMPSPAKEWVQREWIQPQVDLYHNRGDFYNLSGLSPNIIQETLKRDPAWSSILDLPDAIHNLRGAFFDDFNNRYVLIGQNAASDAVVSTYFTSAWAAQGTVYTLTSATNSLGGQSMHNAAYWGGDLYLIGADKKVYRGSSYTSALTEFYGTADASLLCPCGDRMYLITEDGKVLRLNDADTAFETHYDPIATLEVLYATTFRGYLALFARGDNGTLYIYRLPDRGTETPTTLHQIAAIPFASGDLPNQGSLFAVHDDQIYFSPGRLAKPDGNHTVPIYRFNGSQIKQIAELTNTPDSFETIGLINWRNRLLYYALNDSEGQTFKTLHGNHFTDFSTLTTDTQYSHLIASLNGELLIAAYHATSGEGIHHCGGTNLKDEGYLVTSYLDMNHPGLQKRLNRIVVLLDGAATDFKVVIKYRTDDNTSWTTAATGNNTRRALADDLSAHFYTLQLRIELDDDTGAGNQDIRILAVSVIYSN